MGELETKSIKQLQHEISHQQSTEQTGIRNSTSLSFLVKAHPNPLQHNYPWKLEPLSRKVVAAVTSAMPIDMTIYFLNLYGESAMTSMDDFYTMLG